MSALCYLERICRMQLSLCLAVDLDRYRSTIRDDLHPELLMWVDQQRPVEDGVGRNGSNQEGVDPRGDDWPSSREVVSS